MLGREIQLTGSYDLQPLLIERELSSIWYWQVCRVWPDRLNFLKEKVIY